LFQPTLPVLACQPFPPPCQLTPRFQASLLRTLCYLISVTSSRLTFPPGRRRFCVTYSILGLTVPLPFQRFGIALASLCSVFLWPVACYLFYFTYSILGLTVSVLFQRFGIAFASLCSVFLWPVPCYLFYCSAYLVLVPSVPSSIKGRPSIAVSRFPTHPLSPQRQL
jgi:hypothetical protein